MGQVYAGYLLVHKLQDKHQAQLAAGVKLARSKIPGK